MWFLVVGVVNDIGVLMCRVEAICVLNQKKVYEDKSYPRVSPLGGASCHWKQTSLHTFLLNVLLILNNQV